MLYNGPMNSAFAGVDNLDSIDPQALSLMLSNTFAQASIQPAVDARLVGHVPIDESEQDTPPPKIAVLTNLDDLIMMRVVPYVDGLLLSVPFSAFAKSSREDDGRTTAILSLDFLAIPHETGHVLFRHGRIKTEEQVVFIQDLLRGRLLSKLYRKSSDLQPSLWLIRWLEELFSDAYGCLVSGVMTAFAFQYLLASGEPFHPSFAESIHPTPLLRPLMHRRILDLFYPEMALEHQKIEDGWRKWVADNWYVEDIEAQIYEIDHQKLSGTEILKEIEPLIDVIVSGLCEWIDTEEIDLVWANWERHQNGTISAPAAAILPPIRPEPPESAPNHAQQYIYHLLENETDLELIINEILFRGWSNEQTTTGGGSKLMM